MPRGKSAYWRRLDNAAKLYSAASNKKDTRVFRVYCELKEEVEPETLQKALDKTLEKYPVFLSVMRKGLFWHYLEKSSLHPVVKKEYREPCSNIYIRDKRELLFEVTYYNNRINFEVFHALTDGTGAIEFVRELIKNYLLLAHEGELQDVNLIEKRVSVSELEDDGFSKYYSKKIKPKKKWKQSAYQISKSKHKMDNLQITEAEVSTKELLKKAKEYGVSLTIYLTAVFMCAIHRSMSMRHEGKKIVLMIPVNLRKFFPSDSMLNFFSWIEPEYKFGEESSALADVIAKMKETFARELTAQKMAEKMSEYIALEENPILRLAPLELKNRCISAGTMTSARETTAIYSNMGIIKMPESYEPYIERFGVFTSTPKLELCMVSFKEKVHFGFTSRYDSFEIKEAFFDILEKEGIEIEHLEPEYSEAVTADSKGMKMFKIFSFLTIVAAVITTCIDYGSNQQFNFSLLACGGIASMWFAAAVAFSKRYNMLKNAMWQLVIVTNVCCLWDILTTWRGWSVEYVYPLMSMAVIGAMIAVIKIYRINVMDYMIYLLMASLYGLIIPLIFILTGLAEMVMFCVASMGVSVITLAALIMFRGNAMRDELEKKLHV